MAEKKIIIIGAGIAGLAAGCYAKLNGYDVEILEMHNKPGGMCTSWKRKDYIFDYCIHNLAGTSPSTGIYQVWQELGALDDNATIISNEFVRIETFDGKALHWYTDLDKLESHLKEIASEDSDAIDELLSAARKLVGSDLSSIQLGGLIRTLKALPYVSTINHWSKIKVCQFVERLKNPFLRRALLHIMYDMPGDKVPMTALILFMAGLQSGDFGFPAGGSLAFSRRIEKRLLDLGGVIHFKTKVKKIIVENNRAVGVFLDDGSELRADYIISAADGYNTIYNMLDGKYLTDHIRQYYALVGDSSPFGFIIFLGLDCEYLDVPHAMIPIFDEPLDLGEIKQDSVYIVTYGSNTGLVPAEKSIMKIEVQAKYPYWKTRRDADIKKYREEKQRIADVIISRIEPRFTGIRENIEVIDISTPPTTERYTGNRFGWQAGPPEENASEIQRKGLSVTLPGLDGFFHVGQWSNATLGVSSSALSSRGAIKKLCRIDGKKFVLKI